MVEEMLAFRGIEVSHETIRQWGLKFFRSSPTSSAGGCPDPGDKLEKSKAIKAIRPKLRDLLPQLERLEGIGARHRPRHHRRLYFRHRSGRQPRRVDVRVLRAWKNASRRHPEQFGKGAIAGVAGPETANNATTGTAMIPLLALGIPSIPATAILLSALTIHGVPPGLC